MTEILEETLTGERLTLVRAIELPLSDGWDGRTLDLQIVPYNEPTTVADPPDFQPYREMFLPGAFERQLKTPGRDRVFLNFEHEKGIRGIVGQSLSFRDGERGLEASFGVHENSDGDKALMLVQNRVLTGISLEYRPLSSRRLDGVVQRVRAQLDKVSLCRFPAYPTAEVLAVREEPETTEPPVAPPPKFERSTDVDERLAALGFEPLVRIATTSAAWDGSPARYTDEQYRAAALFCRGTDAPPKEDCSLPVLEPTGALNVNALGAAAAALAGARGGLANATREQKAQAARKLVRYYNVAKMEAPESLRKLAAQ